MAPKGAPPPEPEPEPEPDPDPYETHEIVCSLLGEIVDQSLAVVAEKARREAVVPHVVASIEAQIKMCLDVHFLDYDIGEPEGAANWAPGAEPVPVPIDAWSRGAVKQLVKMPSLPAESLPPAPAESTTGRLSPRVRTPGSAAPGPAPPAQGGDARAPIFVAKPPPGYEPPPKKTPAPIVTPAEKLKKRLETEARDEVERLERLKTDLKGREYTYDARGNIIVMEDMFPDRLPPFQQQPRLGLQAEKQRNKRGKPQPARGTKVEFGSSVAFKQLDSLQPPVTETMSVNKGVLLKFGEATKGGEPREFDGERISRSTFQELANSTGGFSARRPIATDAAAATKNPLSSTAPDVPPTPAKPPAMPGESASPAVRPPSMPPSPQPGESHGIRNNHQRERGGMPTKTKLPPPNLGATTGHGQALPYAGQPPGVSDSVASSTASSPARSSAIKPAKGAADLLR